MIVFVSGHPVRALIIDMDGVLWRGPEPIGNLPAIFTEIKKYELRFTLATNNATRTVDQYVEKLHRFGVDLSVEQVINSAQATARYLSKQYPQGGPVYLIGEHGLIEALAAHQFFPSTDNALAVIVGLDRHLTYEKLRQAALFIREGIPFIGTNPDRTLPSPEGLVPGSGSILAALEAATDIEPTIIGKPQSEMYRVALDRMRVSPQETLVIGDRLETDIAGGQALGCLTAVVLTGATSEADAWAWEPGLDIIASDLTNLIQLLS